MKGKIFSRYFGIVLMVSVLALSPSAFAGHGDGKGPKGDRGEHIEKMADQLNLTADQKAKIKSLRDNFKQQHEAQFQEIKNLREQHRDLKKSGSKESDQAKQLQAQIKTKMEAVRADREKLHEQIMTILTPEQRAQAEKMKSEHKERKGGKQKGRRGGQGTTGGSSLK